MIQQKIVWSSIFNAEKKKKSISSQSLTYQIELVKDFVMRETGLKFEETVSLIVLCCKGLFLA